MDLSVLYGKEYVDSNYGDLDGIRRNFERIHGLPPEQSDNVQRVGRVLAFAGPSNRRRSILDVGSGLCVFLHRMKEAGWDCVALDPDPRSCRHAREHVGVRAVCGDFMHVDDLGQHDAISFNKVLEHVADPVTMLARAARFVRPDGFVYVELPDAEAWHEGPGREEFFIDHFHVFSMASIALLAERTGFRVMEMERLREPSTKFTLRAFLRLACA
jgi:SAM-dependent methyltransferase